VVERQASYIQETPSPEPHLPRKEERQHSTVALDPTEGFELGTGRGIGSDAFDTGKKRVLRADKNLF
jgi:hypothetical protein